MTVEIPSRSIVIGDGSKYTWSGSIGGLGQEVRNNDVTKGHADGAVAQLDYREVKMLSFPISIGKSGPQSSLSDPDKIRTRDDIWTAWQVLKTAWDISDIDVALEVHYSASYVETYMGRPNGYLLIPDDMMKGRLRLKATLAFRAVDPTAY